MDHGQGRGRGRPIRPEERSDLRRPHMMPTELVHNPIAVAGAVHLAATNSDIVNAAISNQQSGMIQNAAMHAAYGVNMPGVRQVAAPMLATMEGPLIYSQLGQNFSTLNIGGHPSQATSILSPNAPEFVPRVFQAYQQIPPELQQTLMPPDMSQTNPQIVPRHTMPQWEYLDHPVLHQIDGLVVNLTLKPYKFEEVAVQMTSILSYQVKEANLMKEIVTLILEQGIGEANFRFSGSRLCQHLNQHIKHSYNNGPTFRELLLRWCQDEFSCKDYYIRVNPARLRGFSLFLADLFTQLVTASSQPLDALQKALCKLLITLMAEPEEDNLKCVIKVLKGAGSVLDSGDNEAMENVMFCLKDLTITAQLPPDIKSSLVSTIELRASNWGRSSSSDSSNSAVPDIPLGTVFYGPDGQIKKIVLDEVEDSDTDDSQYGYSPTNVEELDGDVAKAFEEFLESQKNH